LSEGVFSRSLYVVHTSREGEKINGGQSAMSDE
jgi:hypothetical protein